LCGRGEGGKFLPGVEAALHFLTVMGGRQPMASLLQLQPRDEVVDQYDRYGMPMKPRPQLPILAENPNLL
jgi:hypothetical protein